MLALFDCTNSKLYSKNMVLQTVFKFMVDVELKDSVYYLYTTLPTRYHIFMLRALSSHPEYKDRIKTTKAMCWSQLDKWGIAHDRGLLYVRGRVADAELEVAKEMIGSFQLLEAKIMYSRDNHLLQSPQFLVLKKHVKEYYEKVRVF